MVLGAAGAIGLVPVALKENKFAADSSLRSVGVGLNAMDPGRLVSLST
jgi:hypothetical protein